jgi:hypothetical protein
MTRAGRRADLLPETDGELAMTDIQGRIYITCPECHGTGREYVPRNWDIKPCACLRCGGHGGYHIHASRAKWDNIQGEYYE